MIAMVNVPRAIDAGYACGMFQRRDEISGFCMWLMTRLQGGCAIEIGAHRGGTSVLWCELGFNPVLSVDMCDGPWGGIGSAAARERDRAISSNYPGVYIHIEGNSHWPEIAAQVADMIPPGGASLLFIDGDHSLKGVREDFALYSPLVRRDGVVAFHDISDTPLHHARGVEVSDFWAGLKGLEKFEFKDLGGEWGGIGAVVL